jgi:phenylpropionate dioxygenase-like ring-hydroxylating dioxygenase large terminal subunit
MNKWLFFFIFVTLQPISINAFKLGFRSVNIFKNEYYDAKNINLPEIEVIESNDKNWYVIGEKNEFAKNKLYKKIVWNNDYVVWKNNDEFFAMDNHCSHRGASLANGKLINQNVACPYHGYEFNSNGVLCKVPGLSFKNNRCQNMKSYQIREKNGWVYLNINATLDEPVVPIFEEPEAKQVNCTANFLNIPFNSYARLVSENSLDVMHIAYVHSFGNIQVPSPIYENPPKLQDDYPYHYKTEYIYVAGNDSIAKKIFNSSFLNVDVEFILPHTQIVRVKFDKYVSTIITFVTPINITHSQVYMKTYRSYWFIQNATNFFEKFYNYVFNRFTENVMKDTIMQDKFVVENIKPEHMDGNYNMKFDKPGNVYRHLYKKNIHEIKKYT